MKTLFTHQVRNVFAIGIVSVLLGVTYYTNPSLFKAENAQAGTAQNVSGYVWSENIGWISFNSTSDGSVTSYGVNVDTTNKVAGGTGDFSGQAWSDNIGWISFNRADTGTPPAAPFNGATGPIAQINWGTGKVSGWARAVSSVGATNGWDGWIKLSDDTVGVWTGKGVKVSGNRFSGYAWGGSDGAGVAGVVGWVDFAPTVGGVPVGPIIAAPPCLATDASVVWGSCTPTVNSCTAPPATALVNGIQVGICPSGGTVLRACTVTITCTAGGGGGGGGGAVCGDAVCGTGETVLNCPADCKPGFQQF